MDSSPAASFCAVDLVMYCQMQSSFNKLCGVLVFLGQVFDFLKGAITRCFKDEQVQQGSKFLQDLVAPPCSVSTMILETVKNRLECFFFIYEVC